MDGFQDFDGFGHDLTPAPAVSLAPVRLPHDGLIEHRLDALDTLVVTKLVAGFDDACVDSLRLIVEDLATGRRPGVKFLVLDFAHHVERDSVGGEGFHRLVSELANLILRAPVVSIACARSTMAGADLELALACSMMIGEAGRRFSFATDPIISMATYGFLSHKLGFVRAERLMERGEILDCERMHELLLVKTVLDRGAGLAGIEQFLVRVGRRHNSCLGIYRAQRIASPTFVDEMDARLI